MKRLVLLIAGFMLAGFAQANYINQTFDGLTPTNNTTRASDIGAYALSGTGEGTEFSVVDSGPLTGANDHSLRILDASESRVPIAFYDPSEDVTSGQLTLDFYLVDVGGPAGNDKRFDIRFLNNNVIGINLRSTANGLEYRTGAVWHTFEQTCALDTAHTLQIDFTASASGSTFSGILDSHELTFDGENTFDFYTDQTAIDRVYLGVTWAAGTGEAYVDNIAMVPEPATVGLFTVFGMGLMLLRRLQFM